MPARNDVYVAARNLAGAFKVSLHESGRWRVAFTNPENPLIPEGQDRAVYKWQRPDELAHGVTRAFEIGIPATEVAVPPEPIKHHAETLWFAPPPKGEAANFDVFLASPGFDLSEGWPGRDAMNARLIFDTQMSNGHQVFVLMHTAPMPQAIRDAFAQHLPTMRGGSTRATATLCLAPFAAFCSEPSTKTAPRSSSTYATLGSRSAAQKVDGLGEPDYRPAAATPNVWAKIRATYASSGRGRRPVP